MEQKDDEAEKREIIRPASAISPIPDATIEPKTKRFNWLKLHWVKCALVVACLTTAATLFDIPNIVMSWFINWRELSKDEPEFSITAPSILYDNRVFDGGMKGGGIWYYYPPANAAYPISKCLFVHFTNLKPMQLMIDRYSIEGKQSNGNWVKIPCVDTTWGGELIFEFSLESVGRFQATPTFDAVTKANAIPPGGTVKGWIFLGRSQRDVRADTLRFGFTDGAGVEHSREFYVPEGKRDLGDVDFRGAGMLKLGDTNMNGMRRLYYEDRYK